MPEWAHSPKALNAPNNSSYEAFPNPEQLPSCADADALLNTGSCGQTTRLFFFYLRNVLHIDFSFHVSANTPVMRITPI